MRKRIPAPDGFMRITWQDLHKGDEVYLLRVVRNTSIAKGPYHVKDPKKHLMETNTIYPLYYLGLLVKDKR